MSTLDDNQTTGRAPVTARVSAALTELIAQADALLSQHPEALLARADRADQLAMICARRAGWWRLLLTSAHRQTVPDLYRRAVIAAGFEQHDQARFWRDTAADWRAQATRQPTSDAAGAMSNHHDLGIAS
ncbi:hypothetical protein [Pseudonocardia sp. D17]|jgi:hypothetical protein|uniref:hypothetical protein n=1 Tax=Pseudonocardia sp. D17 TaxID=882661 RepID=UPI002B3D557C|nr:hypothetical protein PSD17_26290 [Pseudonocardia sp. D17]